ALTGLAWSDQPKSICATMVGWLVRCRRLVRNPGVRRDRLRDLARNQRIYAAPTTTTRSLSAANIRKCDTGTAGSSQPRRRPAGRSLHSQQQAAERLDPLLLPDA